MAIKQRPGEQDNNNIQPSWLCFWHNSRARLLLGHSLEHLFALALQDGGFSVERKGIRSMRAHLAHRELLKRRSAEDLELPLGKTSFMVIGFFGVLTPLQTKANGVHTKYLLLQACLVTMFCSAHFNDSRHLFQLFVKALS